jgi:hypothetical protein
MRLALAALLAVAPVAAQETPLRAGLARIEISPSQFGPMYGYSNRRCGPGVGVHDPLYAKALVLETGQTRLALVTLDLGSMVSTTLRDRVREKLGIGTLLLAASHSHSTPSFLPYGDAPASPYLAEVEGKIFTAVQEAAGKMFPARLAVARGALQLGYNRLLPRADGRSRALFENPERVPYGPVDPEYAVLRVSDDAGATRAVIVHYATHAVVLGPTNCKYSADYPGAMQTRIEKEMEGVQAMFVQGAAGDVNPLSMARSGKEDDDFAVVRKMGETLAGEVLALVKQMPAAAPNRRPILVESETLEFPDRWDASRKKLQVGITTVLLNGEIAIAAMPGEPLHRLQVEWKRRAEAAQPLFYGYTSSCGNEWPGYIPDLRSAARGGYGADASTRIAVGAGEALIERHLFHLYKMLGMWRDQPGKN